MSAAAPVPLAIPAAPYKGLESYQFCDSAIFTSRERDAEKLLRLVTIYRSVLLYGVQGAGKSSLINAAFLPKAVSEGYAPELLRVHARPGQEIVASRIALEQPGRAPYLRSNLLPDDGELHAVMSMHELLERVDNVPDGDYPLLIFDQFEELISQFEESPSEISREEALNLQLDLMLALIDLSRSDTIRAKVLFVFRQDYLARLGRMFGQVPNLLTTALFLQPLSTQHLSDIIRGPFQRFPKQYDRQISPDLAQAIEEAFRERARNAELNLSEVQIVCLTLWRSSDAAAHFRELGIDGILRRYFSHTLSALPVESVSPAVALLEILVTDTNVRNVVERDNLLYLANKKRRHSQGALRSALERLESDARLVRHERRGEVLLYEIVSESLIPWIREQQAKFKLRGQRRRWILYAAAACVLALLSMSASGWLLHRRTERVLRDAKVKELIARERTLDEQLKSTRAQLFASESKLLDQDKHFHKLLAEVGAAKAPEQAPVIAELQKANDAKATAIEAERRKQSELAAQLAAMKTSLETVTGERERFRQQADAASRAPQAATGAGTTQINEKIATLEATVDRLTRERDAAAATVKAASGEPEILDLPGYTAYVLKSAFLHGRVAIVTERLQRGVSGRMTIVITESPFGLKPGPYTDLVNSGDFRQGADAERLKTVLRASGPVTVRPLNVLRPAGASSATSTKITAGDLTFRLVAISAENVSDTVTVLAFPSL